jgi:hypothetical protein
MNFLLLNLLRMAGVSCYPLLVSTHENGNPDESFSILSQFNGLDLIVYDSLLFYVVDCTQKDLSFKIPPYNILNTYAYLVDFDKYGWIFVTDNRISMIKETSIQAEMDSQGVIKGLSQSRMIGYVRSTEMEKIRNQGKSKDRSAPGENMTDLVMDSVSYIHNLDDNDTLIEKMSFRFKPSNTDKIYFINPLLFAVQEENPFRDSIRLSDIDFGAKQSYRVNVELKLPDNFFPASLPADILLEKQDSTIRFERKITFHHQVIEIQTSYTLKTEIFFKEDYGEIRRFFSQYYRFVNDPVLIIWNK